MTPKTLDASNTDWKGFYENFWKDSITVVKNCIQSPFLSSQELFLAIIHTKKYCLVNNVSLDWLRLYDENAQLIDSGKDYLTPIEEDIDFYGYENRLKGIKGFSSFGLIVYDLEVISTAGHRALNFFSELIEYTKLPHQFFNMHAFIGNYEGTPFGVHTDPVRTFIHHIMGEKQLWLWEPSKWLSYGRPLKTMNFMDKIEDAFELNLGKKDLGFFTPKYPHIARTNGLTISVTSDFWSRVRKYPAGTLRGSKVTIEDLIEAQI